MNETIDDNGAHHDPTNGEFAAKPAADAPGGTANATLGDLKAPADYDGSFPLTAAADYIDDRIDNTQAYTACADYAEVSADGITYGMNLGNIYAELYGTDPDGAVDWDGLPDGDIAKVEAFIRDRYTKGEAWLVDDGDEGAVSIEFKVEFEDGTAAGESLEQMGDRADNETDLARAHNEHAYGNAMMNDLGRHLGRDWDDAKQHWVAAEPTDV